MTLEPEHRKRIKHYEDPGHLRELTFSCYRRQPLLVDDSWREMLSRSTDAASERHDCRLAAFVYMPEHVHLLFFPLPGAAAIEHLIKAIKRPYSYRIKQQLVASQSPLLYELTVRQRPGVMTFRYWQEGPGYDRNLFKPDAVLAAIDYLHLNPVRRKLCERAVDYRWSSACWFASGSSDAALPRLTQLPSYFFL